GWSTVLLNSDGILWMFGNIGKVNYGFTPFEPYARKLGFPPAYPATSKQRYEPSTAVAQFSTGRACVLGLSDDGKVWHWQKQVAFLVKPLHVDVEENRVTRVVAGMTSIKREGQANRSLLGWEEASMYVNNVGIVYWRHIIAPERLDSDADSLLMDTTTIPGTGFRRPHNRQNDDLDTSIGEVVNHIVLERYIVFTTDDNQIFYFDTSTSSTAVAVELTSFYSNETPFQIRDIQGSFQSFAVFTTSGSILTGTVTNLEEPTRLPTIIHSHQGSSIISLAYGDHHFLALRANGVMSAYGRELNSCGAFGLGNNWDTAPLRGVGVTDFAGNGVVLGDRGREIWFEPLMKVWLEDMREKGRDTARGNMVLERDNRENFETIKAVGDFTEGEGRKWEKGVTAEGDMGAYFVLKVAAAGWHSAALVLVDEEKAEQARQNHIIKPEERSVTPQETLDRDGRTQGIDTPWNGSSRAPWSVFNWALELGRWFLGLTDRDARTAEGQQSSAETDRESDRYTWTDQPFPSLNIHGPS
ncbi:MAG: hypothetical protein Q9214_002777, partial [Letrouitia sp. 1 TL-2023]